jgi:hypothetical protein
MNFQALQISFLDIELNSNQYISNIGCYLSITGSVNKFIDVLILSDPQNSAYFKITNPNDNV